jgi:dATP pyrophosphohydrolase
LAHVEYKRPESVLIVVHTRTGKVLLLRRVDHPDFWQSVTGSLKWDETPMPAAVRELREETGLDEQGRLRDWRKSFCFEILPGWSRRFAPGVTHNIEHVFSLELMGEVVVTLNPREHDEYCWMTAKDAARKVWSWTNRAAIEQLMMHNGVPQIDAEGGGE